VDDDGVVVLIEQEVKYFAVLCRVFGNQFPVHAFHDAVNCITTDASVLHAVNDLFHVSSSDGDRYYAEVFLQTFTEFHFLFGRTEVDNGSYSQVFQFL